MSKFNTLAVHAGQDVDVATGAVIPPLHLSSTFKQDGVGNMRAGYEYSRSGNPTRANLQTNLAALEGGSHAFAFSSGLAAEDTLLRSLLQPGDHVVIANDVYGGTYRLINGVFSKWGITHTAIDMSDPEGARAVIASTKPKVVWIETPSNPMLRIIDIAAMVEVAHASGAVVVVDNTFATPALQQPLSLGADAVVHSTTKYLGGHSDVVGGAVILQNYTLAEQVAYLHNAAGAIASPFDSYLTVRGIKTLAVRMDRHSQNAGAIAERLQSHPRVENVFYPGLPSHVGHDIARAQMSGFGGMISITVTGGEAAARHVVANTHLFTLAESLGGVESLVEFPFAMTHASVAGTALAVPENLVRLSVGIEDVDDLTDDIVAALDSLDSLANNA
ncbi:cystathionine gamma-synthase [Alpinimonas psychrophila]|uniref:Cystathionine gamma-synthase n=1 Tax=Alpinimonas psychrophila TaxID=748908 RepID=A0A7W3PNQ4_9MICO|nr:cystathionine gamma-synthase [Alpinimonas psychrophila]MBA8828453.1 cystathionine gamma-synthase [Alpinimonas psychrophila]